MMQILFTATSPPLRYRIKARVCTIPTNLVVLLGEENTKMHMQGHSVAQELMSSRMTMVVRSTLQGTAFPLKLRSGEPSRGPARMPEGLQGDQRPEEFAFL